MSRGIFVGFFAIFAMVICIILGFYGLIGYVAVKIVTDPRAVAQSIGNTAGNVAKGFNETK